MAAKDTLSVTKLRMENLVSSRAPVSIHSLFILIVRRAAGRSLTDFSSGLHAEQV